MKNICTEPNTSRPEATHSGADSSANSTEPGAAKLQQRHVRITKENVLLANGSACYRAIDPCPDVEVSGKSMSLRVVECVARSGLKKCVLNLSELDERQKRFKNGAKVFKPGDRVTILCSRVYDEYLAMCPCFPLPPCAFLPCPTGIMVPRAIISYPSMSPLVLLPGAQGSDKIQMEATSDGKCDETLGSCKDMAPKKRNYGREEKDGSNVWIIVTGKDGVSRLWQRNMELVGSLVDISSEQYMEVNVTGAGITSTMARVRHRSGGEQRLCYQFRVSQEHTLWVDRDLFYTSEPVQTEKNKDKEQVEQADDTYDYKNILCDTYEEADKHFSDDWL